MDNVIRGLLHAWNGDFANFRDVIQSELLSRAAARINDIRPIVAQSMFEDTQIYHSAGIGDVPLQYSIADRRDRIHKAQNIELPKSYELELALPKVRAGARRADRTDVGMAK